MFEIMVLWLSGLGLYACLYLIGDYFDGGIYEDQKNYWKDYISYICPFKKISGLG